MSLEHKLKVFSFAIQEARDTLYNEVRFMKLLKHPHIVGLYEV